MHVRPIKPCIVVVKATKLFIGSQAVIATEALLMYWLGVSGSIIFHIKGFIDATTTYTISTA